MADSLHPQSPIGSAHGSAVENFHKWKIIKNNPCPVPISVSLFSAECEDLDDPEHGDVTMTDGTHQGSLASYSCDADYELSDASVRVCLSTGYWSGWAPTCIPYGKCIYIT